MKHTYKLKIFLLLLSVALFSQCGIRQVSMNAMRSADITFPSYVNTLVVVDRTKFDKEAINILEGVLTGEMPGEDKAGMQQAMASFQETILSSPRFQVKMANERLKGNSITSAFPDALSWNQVESICSQYGAEAMVAIEIFDTDFIPTNGKRKVKKKVKDADGVEREIETDEFYAQGVANVTIGFRLYDPKAKSIIDQQLFTKTNTWDAVGTSVLDAAAHLIAKSEATRYVSGLAGTDYAFKLAPMPIRITREFYSKSKKTREITAGARQADVNDWKGAIETWEDGIAHSRDKEAGRLCYNIAVAYEVLGDMPNAKKWVQRAYVDYGNKKARDYSSMLDQRMREDERVEQQMK